MIKFKRFYIEISNICNMHCSFCSPLNRQAAIMTREQFENILKNISPFKDAQLYFHVKGEPLMHPQLKEFLDLAYIYNRKVNITTNGTLLYKVGDILLSSRSVRQVNISVHSLENADSEKQNKYLTEISNFGLKAKSTNINISYRMWQGNGELSQHNKDILSILIEKFGVEKKDDWHTSREAIKLAPHIYVSYQDEFTWPSLSLPYISDRGNCLGGKNMLAFLVDGTICPCCLDGDGIIKLGNIFDNDLETILQGERYKKLLSGFCGGKLSEELCKKCVYRTRFDKK